MRGGRAGAGADADAGAGAGGGGPPASVARAFLATLPPTAPAELLAYVRGIVDVYDMAAIAVAAGAERVVAAWRSFAAAHPAVFPLAWASVQQHSVRDAELGIPGGKVRRRTVMIPRCVHAVFLRALRDTRAALGALALGNTVAVARLRVRPTAPHMGAGFNFWPPPLVVNELLGAVGIRMPEWASRRRLSGRRWLEVLSIEVRLLGGLEDAAPLTTVTGTDPPPPGFAGTPPSLLDPAAGLPRAAPEPFVTVELSWTMARYRWSERILPLPPDGPVDSPWRGQLVV